MTSTNSSPATFGFRVATPNLPTITQNCESVVFDFMQSALTIRVKQTMDPSSFEEAYLFACDPDFKITAHDDTVSGTFFEISPVAPSLLSHKLEATPTGAVHVYNFVYSGIHTGAAEVAQPAEHDGDPRFPTPADALALIHTEVLELDYEQEMRFTPDHPDEIVVKVDKVAKASKKG